MASLSLRHIYKIYPGGVKAVNDFNLEIADKEFIVFVGPSGCGKSTTLRMIAGLEDITDGELYIDGKLMNHVEPKNRDIAMVFQNYALFPHMTVYENMAFSLRIRKIPNDEIDRRVKEAAQILGIADLLTRKPKALSGGQKQRVALGRAIVREPKVFLLDEPLSNLDAKLRVQMRTEITKIHNRLATTFIYVTHDQTEAMTMGTRIVVMKDGVMQQVDTPQNLFDNPCNIFVATFIGTPQMNLIKAKLEKKGKNLVVKFGNNSIQLPESTIKKLTDESYIGKEVYFGVRPEDIHDEEIFINASPNTVINAVVEVIEKLGDETILHTKVDGKEDSLVARVDARAQANPGDKIKLAIDANHVHLFDPETELSILGVPKFNHVAAKLDEKDGKYSLTFGSNVLEMPPVNVTNTSYIGGNVKVGIAPESLSIVKGKSEYPVIEAVVDFVEDADIYKNIYLKIEGKNGLFAMRAPADTKCNSGDKLKIAVNTAEIVLFDNETGVRISSRFKTKQTNEAISPLTKKTSKSGETLYEVFFAGKTLTLPSGTQLKAEPAEVGIVVPSSSILSTKAELSGIKNVYKYWIADLDNTGTEVFARGKVDGFDDIFYAKLPVDFKGTEGDKIKIAIAVDKIDIVDVNTKESLLVKA